jgi:hypothetical protein
MNCVHVGHARAGYWRPSTGLCIERGVGSSIHLAEPIGRNVSVDVFMLVNHDRPRAAEPAHIRHGDERARTEALLDQHFFPARELGCCRGDHLCGRPIVFDQREEIKLAFLAPGIKGVTSNRKLCRRSARFAKDLGAKLAKTAGRTTSMEAPKLIPHPRPP